MKKYVLLLISTIIVLLLIVSSMASTGFELNNYIGLGRPLNETELNNFYGYSGTGTRFTVYNADTGEQLAKKGPYYKGQTHERNQKTERRTSAIKSES